MDSHVSARFLIISDTHGEKLIHQPLDQVDVAIHCGDLTEESKLDEFRTSLELLRSIKSPLKLVIAGNHDFAMDIPMFKKKLADIKPPLEDDLVKREYGAFGEARELFENEDTKAAGIVFLDEGTHQFTLANGAPLTVYASPYTPSLSDWGFQYHPQQDHDWTIDPGVDVVITHGPPKGVLDYTDSRQRAGSASLFGAIARARPQIHCFGHIHEGWGAKRVTWRDPVSKTPSHFTDIDNDSSVVIETLAEIQRRKFDTPEVISEKESKLKRYQQKRCCIADEPVKKGTQTLFVNAATEGKDDDSQQLPWVANVDLPRVEKQETPPTIKEATSKKRNVHPEVSEDGSRSNKRVFALTSPSEGPTTAVPLEKGSCI